MSKTINNMRIVFVNLHNNEMLVKTMNKIIFKQSIAIKHKYWLDYLLSNSDIEVCSYINKQGFSMASNLSPLLMKFLRVFRFMEHRVVMRKNGIELKKIQILRKESQIKPDDIVVAYRHCPTSLLGLENISAFTAISLIHFWGTRKESMRLMEIQPGCLFNEVDMKAHSEIFQRYYGWFNDTIIIHPFVFASRFQRKVSFDKRENRAFAVGTITYKNDPDFLEVYGDPCDQPSRKQIKDNANELMDYLVCYSSDYNENAKGKEYKKGDSGLVSFYKKLYNRTHQGQQKQYYSFDMVERFNHFKMCIVGEEILGVPGIGFVEGMACGCAYIGQTTGYYEDYGMQNGVHYIGYDGTLDDLKKKIAYYQQPEHQKELEAIADEGYRFAQEHFNGKAVAELLTSRLVARQKEWMNSNHSN